MELPPSRFSSQPQLKDLATSSPSMSALAVRAPSLLPSPGGAVWEDRRGPEFISRPRAETLPSERVELPSIRQAIPEIHQVRGTWTEPDYRTESVPYSPPERLGASIAPEYVQSPYKRRRLSSQEDAFDARDPVAPRLYKSPPRPYQPPSATVSPRSGSRRTSIFSTSESWTSSAHTSPHMRGQSVSTMRSPPPFDSSSITQSKWRPKLPSLPALTFEAPASQAPRAPSTWGEYTPESARSGAPPFNHQSTPPLTFQYQPHGLSYSGPSTSFPVSHDRTPFSNSHHSGFPAGFQYPMEVNEMGNDSKQRKRRGNLPKETTDKLRAWFVAHLQHPYPTEGEKQELMRQTGLQMNQISNWFINSRRRQLPAMINNARAESDAKSARSGEGKTSGGSTGDCGDDRGKRSSPSGDSDGDGSGYDEEYEGPGRRSGAQRIQEKEST